MTLQEVMDNDKFLRTMFQNLTNLGFEIYAFTPPNEKYQGMGIYAELKGSVFKVESTSTTVHILKNDTWVTFYAISQDTIAFQTQGLGDFKVFSQYENINLTSIWKNDATEQSEEATHDEYIKYDQIEEKLRIVLKS